MLKKANKRTAELIKEKIIDANVLKLPITSETILTVFEWFYDEEVALANAEADGEHINETYFREISTVVDELLETAEEKVDLDHLNNLINSL